MASNQACCARIGRAEEELEDCCDCDQEVEESHLFLGVMVALPAGLMLWAGALRVAVEIAHRL